MADWVVGVDLGATKTALGLIGPDGRIVARERMPTEAERGPDDLVERIRAAVRANASPRHVPRRVLRVADLPRTRSGKLMEKLVGRLVNRLEPDDVAAVANPDSLESVRQAVALSP